MARPYDFERMIICSYDSTIQYFNASTTRNQKFIPFSLYKM